MKNKIIAACLVITVLLMQNSLIVNSIELTNDSSDEELVINQDLETNIDDITLVDDVNQTKSVSNSTEENDDHIISIDVVETKSEIDEAKNDIMNGIGDTIVD